MTFTRTSPNLGYYSESGTFLRLDIRTDDRRRATFRRDAGTSFWVGEGEGRSEVAISSGSVSEQRLASYAEQFLRHSGPGFVLAEEPQRSSLPKSLSRLREMQEVVEALAEMKNKYRSFPSRLVLDSVEKDVSVAGADKPTHSFRTGTTRLTLIAMTDNGRDIATKSQMLGPGEWRGVEKYLPQLAEDVFDLAGRRSALTRLEPGEYACYFSPDAAAALVHEVLGHVLEIDNYRLLTGGESKFSAARSLSAGISLRTGVPRVGDACYGPSDDMGNPIVSRELVRSGALVGLIGDRDAELEDLRRESWRVPALPRMRSLELSSELSSSTLSKMMNAGPVLMIDEAGMAGMSPRDGTCLIDIDQGRLVGDGPPKEIAQNKIRDNVANLLTAIVGASGPRVRTDMICIKQAQKASVVSLNGGVFVSKARII